jgi:acyl carrier protein
MKRITLPLYPRPGIAGISGNIYPPGTIDQPLRKAFDAGLKVYKNADSHTLLIDAINGFRESLITPLGRVVAYDLEGGSAVIEVDDDMEVRDGMALGIACVGHCDDDDDAPRTVTAVDRVIHAHLFDNNPRSVAESTRRLKESLNNHHTMSKFTKDEINQHINEAIVEKLGCTDWRNRASDDRTINEFDKLEDDLNCNSLNRIELVMEIEDRLNIDLDLNLDYKNVETVAELRALVHRTADE